MILPALMSRGRFTAWAGLMIRSRFVAFGWSWARLKPLAQHRVGTTAVLLRQDNGHGSTAPFTPSDEPPTPSALRSALAERLPPYMVPAALMP